eukprot:TRINITY_DN11981_c0_g1_i4.p1 TRINITY_DN11981_c0_g1~~TRINITY_DN11981_c0_g1_i4.p1  ORF type:complete len:411 (-),score=91.94 TRINITY_DN11981_c0_g1_i4:73-1227(-)
MCIRDRDSAVLEQVRATFDQFVSSLNDFTRRLNYFAPSGEFRKALKKVMRFLLSQNIVLFNQSGLRVDLLVLQVPSYSYRNRLLNTKATLLENEDSERIKDFAAELQDEYFLGVVDIKFALFISLKTTGPYESLSAMLPAVGEELNDPIFMRGGSVDEEDIKEQLVEEEKSKGNSFEKENFSALRKNLITKMQRHARNEDHAARDRTNSMVAVRTNGRSSDLPRRRDSSVSKRGRSWRISGQFLLMFASYNQTTRYKLALHIALFIFVSCDMFSWAIILKNLKIGMLAEGISVFLPFVGVPFLSPLFLWTWAITLQTTLGKLAILLNMMAMGNLTLDMIILATDSTEASIKDNLLVVKAIVLLNKLIISQIAKRLLTKTLPRQG